MKVGYTLTKTGFSVRVNNTAYETRYEQDIWDGLSTEQKHLVAQNLTYAYTNFLPVLLKEETIDYDFPLPPGEPFLFKNQLFDLLSCEIADRAQPLDYIRRFYNTSFQFKNDEPIFPALRSGKQIPDKTTVIVPFTFGKESLTTFALLREIGMNPILFYCQEPVQPYEEPYKRKMLKEFHEKYNATYHFAENGPGLFRYGKAFNLTEASEIGWGSQTTILSLMALPLVQKYNSAAVVFGSEFSNNEYRDHHGWKAFLSYDQTSEMTKEQNNLLRILTGGKSGVYTSLEALEEITIFYLLHHRYAELGKHQFSCTGESPLIGGGQWCHNCYKCSRMYLFARACGVDPASIGFKENILEKPGMFDHYFGTDFKFGSAMELDFAFYVLYKKGIISPYVDLFVKDKLPHLEPWEWYIAQYTKLEPAINLYPAAEKQLLEIFSEELTYFHAYLQSL